MKHLDPKFHRFMHYRGHTYFISNALDPDKVKIWENYCKENKIKLGRWMYCKYCSKNVLPLIGDGIVVCNECGYGIEDLTNLLPTNVDIFLGALIKTLK